MKFIWLEMTLGIMDLKLSKKTWVFKGSNKTIVYRKKLGNIFALMGTHTSNRWELSLGRLREWRACAVRCAFVRRPAAHADRLRMKWTSSELRVVLAELERRLSWLIQAWTALKFASQTRIFLCNWRYTLCHY